MLLYLYINNIWYCVGGTFANESAAENVTGNSKVLEENVAGAIVGSVVSFMSPDQGAGPFYCQGKLLFFWKNHLAHSIYDIAYISYIGYRL